MASRQRGVCVKHLNRCKTSTFELTFQVFAGKLFQAGGVTVDFLVTPTKLWKSTGSLDANFCTCSVAPGRIQVAAGGHVILCFLLLFNCIVKCQPNFNLRFLTSDHSMAPVRFNWSVFASKMHSTSEFAKMFLSKSVHIC